MKRLKDTYWIISLLLLLIGQNNIAQTQGQQELKWARQAFKSNKLYKEYPKFTGTITKLNESSYKFNEKTIVIHSLNDTIENLLKEGIFYPNIITGDNKAIVKTKQELDSMSESQKIFYNLTRTDSIIISSLDFIEKQSKSPKTMRFEFYLWSFGSMNPQICFLEITNQKATKETSLKDFIEYCRVTFFEKGGILI